MYFRSFVSPDIPAGICLPRKFCLQTPEKPFTGSPLIQKKWTPWCLWAYRLHRRELYNVAAALHRGEILGLITKTFLPNYGEFYEMRQFRQGPEQARFLMFDGQWLPFGPQLLFAEEHLDALVVSAEICEDVWSPIPPSIQAAREGAVIIVNCSASDETIGKAAYRKSLIEGQSARLICGYVYANAGEGESTTDVVFGGHNMIAENGTTLAEGTGSITA